MMSGDDIKIEQQPIDDDFDNRDLNRLKSYDDNIASEIDALGPN